MNRLNELYNTNIYAFIYFTLMGLFILTILIIREIKKIKAYEKTRRHQQNCSASKKTIARRERQSKASSTKTEHL